MTESAQVFKGVHDTPNYTDVLLRQADAAVGRRPAGPGHHGNRRVHRAAAGLRLRANRSGLRVLSPPSPPASAPHPARAALAAFRARSLRRVLRPRSPLQRRHRHARPADVRSSATSPSPTTASTPTFCSPGCATTCNPPRSASASPNATSPWPANCPPAHGFTGCQYLKTSASCCARCCTGTATNTTGSGLPADASHPGRGEPAHPSLLADHPRRRRPRRTQPGRPAHQGRRLDRRPRQRLDRPPWTPTTGRPRRHHRAARGVRPDPRHRRTWSTGSGGTTPFAACSPTRCPAAARPVAVRQPAALAAIFDEGDQAHRPAGPGGCAGSRRSQKVLRVCQPRWPDPDSYQAILPVIDMPRQGIAVPRLGVPRRPRRPRHRRHFRLRHPPGDAQPRNGIVRNDRAKENINDQFADAPRRPRRRRRTAQQPAASSPNTNGCCPPTPTNAPWRQGFSSPSAPPTNAPSTTASNGCAKSSAAPARSSCATTAAPRQRLWAAFNPGVAHHRSGVDQFAHPTTTEKMVAVRAA